MNNPFRKDNSLGALIAYVALGAIATGAVTYLYFKKKAITKYTKQQTNLHAGDYLKRDHLKKKRTTDLHDLGKIVGYTI